MTRVLILLTLPPHIAAQYRAGLQEKFPRAQIELVEHHTKALECIADKDVLVTFGPMLHDEVLKAARSLKWIQALGTGVDGILGVGVIAQTLAPICKAFGMRVIGISATPRSAPGFDSIVPKKNLHDAVRELDFLVLLTPLNAETRGIVNAAVLDAMKPSAYL